MSQIIDIGNAKKKLRTGKLLSLQDRRALAIHGNKNEKAAVLKLEQRKAGGTMQVAVKELNHPGFISALSKLDMCDKFPTAAEAYNVMQITKACQETIKAQRDLYRNLVKEYADLDEKGQIKLDEQGGLMFKSTEAQEAHMKKFEEFMETNVTIPGNPVALKTLDKVGLAPMELDSIMCLVDKNTVP